MWSCIFLLPCDGFLCQWLALARLSPDLSATSKGDSWPCCQNTLCACVVRSSLRSSVCKADSAGRREVRNEGQIRCQRKFAAMLRSPKSAPSQSPRLSPKPSPKLSPKLSPKFLPSLPPKSASKLGVKGLAGPTLESSTSFFKLGNFLFFELVLTVAGKRKAGSKDAEVGKKA